jgi:hypothetical protein
MIEFIKDTKENRKLLESILGKPKFIFGDYSYIGIDLQEKTWRTYLNFEWLYTTPPTTTISIEVIVEELRNNKIEEILG